VAERYWSREEVEALIPTLTEIMDGVMKAHADVSAVRERLREEKYRISMVGGAMIDQTAWRKDAGRLERLTAEIQEGLSRIVGLGGVPKDVTLGLVDFLHLRAGQDVNLCWKFGERQIEYWHGLDEGYGGRKPLGGA
jgi:hypothetical protein